jgi:hypothetical protein
MLLQTVLMIYYKERILVFGKSSMVVSFEDGQDLLGHKSSRITTHYSAGEVQSLIDAANKVCRRGEALQR